MPGLSSFKSLIAVALLSFPVIADAQMYRLIEETNANNPGTSYQLLDSIVYTYANNTNRGSSYNADTVNYDSMYYYKGYSKGNLIIDQIAGCTYTTDGKLISRNIQGHDNYFGANTWRYDYGADSIWRTNGLVTLHRVYGLKPAYNPQVLDYIKLEDYAYAYNASKQLLYVEEGRWGFPYTDQRRHDYVYNTNGLLIKDSLSGLSHINGWHGWMNTEYDYNSAGQKVSAKAFDPVNAQGVAKLKYQNYYSYNAQGLLGEDSLYNFEKSTYAVHKYLYNPQGLIMVDTIRSNDLSKYYFVTYDYTSFDYIDQKEQWNYDTTLKTFYQRSISQYKYAHYWPVGISNIYDHSDELVLYPVPANDLLNVKWQHKGITSLQARIVNMQGQTIRSWQDEVDNVYQKQIMINGLPAGQYYLQLVADGAMYRKVFTVLK